MCPGGRCAGGLETRPLGTKVIGMRLFSKLKLRVRSVFRRESANCELEEELRFHLERAIAEKVAAGMSPEEARCAALREFGGVEQIREECSTMRRVNWLQDLAQDMRYGLRMLRKSPGFTTVAVLTLALGIGANTAIFSMMDTLFLRPLPVRRPNELTFLAFPRAAGSFDTQFSGPEFREINEQTHRVFSDSTPFIFGGVSGPTAHPDGLTVDGTTRPVQTAFVGGNFFQFLGLRPYLGRFILPSEGNAPGNDAVVVLSYRCWKARFHSDPGILNKAAFINGRPVTIVGVAPKDFLGIAPIVDMEAYLPFGMMTLETGGDTSFLTDPHTRDILFVGRLALDTTLEAANALLGPVGRRIAKEYPRAGVGIDLEAKPLHPPGIMQGENPMPRLTALFLTLAGLVLALACLNVANLSLVRAAGRQREMAVRAALGASRTRLIRHLLTETILLALLGSVAGMAAGTLALRALSSVAVATDFPMVLEFPFNASVFAYAMAVALSAGILVGVGPALRASGGHVGDVLHEGGRTSTGRGQKMRSALVSAQVAGSLALLIIAGLFVRSFQRGQHADLGFDARNVLNVEIDPAEIGYSKTQGATFYDELLARVRALPDVQAACLARAVPIGDTNQDDRIEVPGFTPRPGEEASVDYNAVSPEYLRTMKIALLQGRDFRDSDNESAPRVALINQAMAARFWPGNSPVGRRFSRNREPQRSIEIVGVVANSKVDDVYSPYRPGFYVPIAQSDVLAQTLQVRTSPTSKVAPEILATIQSLAPAMPVVSVRTMTEAVNGINGLLLFNLGADLTGTLGLLGLTLAIVGVYGVMAHAVGQRTNEIGLRMALGAQRSDILRMMCGRGLLIISTGIALGLLAAIGIAQLVSDFLVGVGRTDPVTYATVTPLLAAVALLACHIPARPATRVDPMVALRHE